MNKLFDTATKVDFTNEPMFLGESQNIQRYDRYKYPAIYRFGEDMLSKFWRPQETDLSDDIGDYNNLLPNEKRVFDFNLKRQIMLDSLQGRTLLNTIGRATTLPELEYALTWVQSFEVIHSESYSHILRTVYDNPDELFDTIMDDEMIMRHTETIKKHYEELYDLINRSESGEHIEDKVMKRAIYLALVSWNSLEAVRFYISFACTWSFGERQRMNGVSKIISLIAGDEKIHCSLSTSIINTLRKKDEGFDEVIKECKEEAKKIYTDTLEEECEWADYLMEEGSLIGLNAEILKSYAGWTAHKRAKAIGIKLDFKPTTSNPIPWTETWLKERAIQSKPQEIEVGEYLVGVMKPMNNSDWKNI